MSIEGGEPAQIADVNTRLVEPSPDSQSVLLLGLDQNGPAVVVCEVAACASPRRLDRSFFGFPARWAPDGHAIAFVQRGPGYNIWLHPLDGSPPRQLTHFTDNRDILDFAWSRDGKRLAIVRATTSTDIVLFKGLRPGS